MGKKDVMKRFVIDYDLPLDKFVIELDRFIQLSVEAESVMPLPIELGNGESLLGQVAFLNSMLNCKTCNAPCCKEDTAVEKEGIGILDCEIAAFELNNYNIPLNKLGTKHAISYPCPLLTSDDRCRAYDIRPLACMLFPFQPGGTTEDGKQLLSVSHGCPSAREIVKQTYINLWRLIHRMEVVMAELHPKNQAKQAQK